MQSVRNPRLRNSAPPLALVFALVMSWTTPVPAVETKVLRDDSFSQFNQGESTGTEVLSQGRLRIGLRAEKLDKTDEGVAWRIVIDPYDGSVFYSCLLYTSPSPRD